MSSDNKYYCIYYSGLPGYTRCNKLLFIKMKPIDDLFTEDVSTINTDDFIKIKEDYLQYEVNSIIEKEYLEGLQIPQQNIKPYKDNLIKLITENTGKRYLVSYQILDKYNNLRVYLKSNIPYKKDFFGNKRLTAIFKKIIEVNIKKLNNYRDLISIDDCKYVYEFFHFYYNYYTTNDLHSQYDNHYHITNDIIIKDINEKFNIYYTNIKDDAFIYNTIAYRNRTMPFYFSGSTKSFYNYFSVNDYKTNILTNFNFTSSNKNSIVDYFAILFYNTNGNIYNLLKTYFNTGPNIYTLYDLTIFNYNSIFYNKHIFSKDTINTIKIQYETDLCVCDTKIRTTSTNSILYLMKINIYIKKELYNNLFFSSEDKEDNQVISSEFIDKILNHTFNFRCLNSSRFYKANNMDYMKQYVSQILSSNKMLEILPFINKSYNKLNTIELDDVSLTNLNINPFEYQKDNIKWMSSLEQNDTRSNFTYLCNPDFIRIIDTPFIYKRLSEFDKCKHKYKHTELRNKGCIIHFDEKEKSKYEHMLNICGGILSDEVGLGKTLSTISHITSSFKSDMLNLKDYDAINLIITPNRLVAQWYSEINKYFNAHLSKSIPVIKIGTITDIKKKLYDTKPNKYAIYIISANLVDNKNYHNYLIHDDYDIAKYKKFVKALDKKLIKTYHLLIKNTHKKYSDFELLGNQELLDELNLFKLDNTKKFNIFKIKWHRIVVDEAHEVLKTNISYNDVFTCFNKEDDEHFGYTIKDASIYFNIKKSERHKAALFCRLVSNYKWCLTATPFKDKISNLYYYINFLNNDYNSIINADYLKFDDMLTIQKREYLLFDMHTNDIYGNGTEKALLSLSKEQIEFFYKHHIRQTTKADIKGVVDIPIFTEEITFLKQNSIERNIYLEALRSNNIKRLLQLCTHIMVSNSDIEDVSFGSRILDLNQIKELMIKKYKVMKLKIIKEKEGSIQMIKDKTKEIDLLEKLIALFSCYNFNSNTSSHYIDSVFKSNLDLLLTTNKHNIYSRRQFRFSDIDCINLIKSIMIDDLSLIIKFIANFDELLETVSILEYPRFVEDDEKYKLFTVFKLYNGHFSNCKTKIGDLTDKLITDDTEIKRLNNQIAIFENDTFVKETVKDPCSICFSDFEDEIAITSCRHIMCGDCTKILFSNHSSVACPFCRTNIHKKDVNFTHYKHLEEPEIAEECSGGGDSDDSKKVNTSEEKIQKYGTKLAYMLDYIGDVLSKSDNRIIIFSQYDDMLKLIGNVLDDFKIKNLFIKGNIMSVSKKIDKFKTDPTYRIIMLSSERCSSGSNLTEASHIIFADVINGDATTTKDMESQAIGRAVRIGQKKPVVVKRIIMQNTIEEEFYTKNKYDMLDLQM
jgi:SNF2 family DNA or RNA helicase